MNADRRLEELFRGLSNYERTRVVTKSWSLANMNAFLEAVGVSESLSGTWVQVGGSKGKGTTVFYIEAMARAAGLATGAFVSPHLHHVTERILLDGTPVAAAVLASALERVRGLADARGLAFSFFEAMTAAAVLVFRDARCEFVALEVGLGGRLDATTAVPVDGGIITRIEREHTELLGDTIEAIATEKAHIMRAGRPCWIQPDPALDRLFEEHARRVGATVRPVARVENLRDEDGAYRGDLRLAEECRSFRVEGASRFELPALALAYSFLRQAIPEACSDLDPVRRPALPGRFEVTTASDGRPMVLDGAHTPRSSAEVVAELRRRFPRQRVAALFASAAGKLWQAGLSELLPVVDRFFVTAPEGTGGVDPGVIVDWLKGQGEAATVVDSPAVGLSELARCDAVRLVVGSFYLVGAVRALLQQQ